MIILSLLVHAPLFVPEDVEGPSLDDLPELDWSEQDLASTPSLRQRIAFMNSNEDAYNANLDLAIKYSEDQDLSKNLDEGRKSIPTIHSG